MLIRIIAQYLFLRWKKSSVSFIVGKHRSRYVLSRDQLFACIQSHPFSHRACSNFPLRPRYHDVCGGSVSSKMWRLENSLPCNGYIRPSAPRTGSPALCFGFTLTERLEHHPPSRFLQADEGCNEIFEPIKHIAIAWKRPLFLGRSHTPSPLQSLNLTRRLRRLLTFRKGPKYFTACIGYITCSRHFQQLQYLSC